MKCKEGFANWCFDKKNFLVLVDDNFKGIVGENVTREQVGEIAKLLTEPAMQYKVGDWVEWHEGLGTTYQSQITRISHSAVYSKGICIPLKIITRKLKPSEVVVKIGCLSGTVRCCDNEFICPESTPDNPCHFVLQDQITGFWSIIYFKMLDAPTRKLVESLLKSQEGGE